jgi:hypothetical protein
VERRNYWEISWPSAGYAHDTVIRIFRWVCVNVRRPSGGPLIDCYDKFAPTETKYETRFHAGESWRDFQKITFNIRRVVELDERSREPHYCMARVTVIRSQHSGSAKVYVQTMYRGRFSPSEYQPKPPQEYRVFDAYVA